MISDDLFYDCNPPWGSSVVQLDYVMSPNSLPVNKIHIYTINLLYQCVCMCVSAHGYTHVYMYIFTIIYIVYYACKQGDASTYTCMKNTYICTKIIIYSP